MRKKLLVLGLVMVLVIGMVPMVSAGSDDGTFALTIMHTNDTHAHHTPNRHGNGGVARQMTVVKQIRAQGDNSLLLDAGDRFTGSLFHQQYLGQENAQIMNMLGYDAMTLGNHEFDKGDLVLGMFIDRLDFTVVSANVDGSASEPLTDKIASYVVLEVDGEKIGITGATIPETAILSSPSEDVVFNDVVSSVQYVVDQMASEGINKIILLTHQGYNADLALAPQLSGVDVIVGGHSHTLLSNMYTKGMASYPQVLESASGDPILVVQAGEYNQYLGQLDLEFDADGVLTDWDGDVILLNQYIAPDPAMQALVDALAAPIEELKQTPVGEAAVELVGERGICRTEECNMGDLITDAIRENTGAQIALQNGGGIRASIPAGDVTLGDVLTVLPFGNLISTFELKGSDVVAALENGVSQVEDVAGRFPQVSGLRYTWNPSAAPGERIVSVEVLNAETGEYEPLDPDATYTVAANDYMRRGGDGYSVLKENAINPYDYGDPLDQVVADYIAANSPVASEVEGRITQVSD